MKNNRRNFYRILQVQPDASLDIIKSNYRTLLHKLRLHPDLGGENLTASYINLAYATLRNPTKRAEYDRQLLNQYKIGVLSKGHLAPKKSRDDVLVDDTGKGNSNRRNYYRILHIQPDAPLAIVSASYKILLKKKTAPMELTREAFSVLSTPDKRQHYDQLLRMDNHVNASMVHSIDRNKKQTRYDRTYSKLKNKDTKYSPSYISADKKRSPYQPLIDKYCMFCKTPQSQSPIQYVDKHCIECSSPLHPAEKFPRPRRFFSRSDLAATVSFYTDWPSNEIVATLSDLSPVGLRFIAKQDLNKNQIIKINADQFQAIGQVKHSKLSGTVFIVGVEFLTVQFNNQKGIFMSASA